jgi:hypothetical protein
MNVAFSVAENREEDSWAVQNDAGRRRADLLIEQIRRGAAPNLLGSVIRNMTNAGEIGQLTGFCHRLSVHLAA